MKFEIRSRWTGAVIFEMDSTSLKLVVEAAVSQRISLRAADLRAANLSDADLRAADLRAADLRAADLRAIRDDVWAVLSAQPREVEGLRKALVEGRIDGTAYEGECACLVGTLANVAGVNYESLCVLKPNSARPAERFFLNIRKGDTPETSQSAKIVLGWVDQWLENVKAAFAGGSR